MMTATATIPQKNIGSMHRPAGGLCAQQPMGTALWHSIASFFSPVSWWRTAVFKRVNLGPLWISCASLVLPPVLLTLYFSVSGDKNHSTRSSSTGPRSSTSAVQSLLVPALWLTPWTAAFAWKASATLHQLWRARKEWISTQSRTKESAWECLAKEVACGRAYRCRDYDVYTPAAAATTTDDGYNIIKRPILFFPGATVEHSAYAPVASLFAQSGYLVVVVSAEPLRIVDEWLLPPRYIRRICSAVEKRHCCGSDWVLMGHSMGSFLCTKLARLLNVKTIVMWACAPSLDFMNDISDSDDLHCLVVQAQNDIVIDAFATEAATKRFWEMLPSRTIQHTIQGGTHSGFGSYIGAWKPEVEGIPVEKQQKEAVRTTIDFLERH